MNYKPLGDYILINPTKANTKTKSGIILAEASRGIPSTGTVVAIGPGRITDDGTNILTDLKLNDTVYYQAYAGVEIELDDNCYIVIKESEILIKRGK